jgi:hypothetical protein
MPHPALKDREREGMREGGERERERKKGGDKGRMGHTNTAGERTRKRKGLRRTTTFITVVNINTTSTYPTPTNYAGSTLLHHQRPCSKGV